MSDDKSNPFSPEKAVILKTMMDQAGKTLADAGVTIVKHCQACGLSMNQIQGVLLVAFTDMLAEGLTHQSEATFGMVVRRLLKQREAARSAPHGDA